MSKSDRLRSLALLMLDQHGFTTIQALADSLGVSSRTIRNDVSSTDFLKLIAPARLVKKPRCGVKIEADQNTVAQIKELVRKDPSPITYNGSDLGRVLARLLTSRRPITLDVLRRDLYLSDSSIYKLMQQVERLVSQIAPSVALRRTRQGYRLDGSESGIRALFYATVTSADTLHVEQDPAEGRLLPQTRSALSAVLQDQAATPAIVEAVHMCETSMGTNFVDQDYNRVLIELAIQLVRVRLGNVLLANHADVRQTQEYYYAVLLKTYYESAFSTRLPEPEIEYTATLIMRARRQSNSLPAQQNVELLEKFIRSLSLRLNIDLTNDFELKENLLRHIRPAMRRMQHGLVSDNPLLQQIRTSFTEIYISVITTIEDLEYMDGFHFDSNEIGFICLHIVAAVNRPQNQRKRRAALLCNEGLSVEVYLKSVIESHFPELAIIDSFNENTIDQFDSESYNVILNSTSQHLATDRSVDISPRFTQEDFDAIKHLLRSKNESIERGMNGLDRLLFFTAAFESRAELVKSYCDLLLAGGYTRPGFHASVENRIKTGSTYIARGIALPHGSKTEVVRSIILLIHLDEPILWDGEQTDFVILVAAADEDTRSLSIVFRKIMQIAANDALSRELKRCQTAHDLQCLIDRIPS